MKRLFVLILLIATFTFQSQARTFVNGIKGSNFEVANSFAIQFGRTLYSGIFNLEYQYHNFSVSVGYFPDQFTAVNHDPSYATVLSFYGSKYLDDTTWYTSLGYNTAGYFAYDPVNNCNSYSRPSVTAIGGYKFANGNFSVKIGAGPGVYVDNSNKYKGMLGLEIAMRIIF